MADVLEAIVLEFGEQGYWFGGEGEDQEVTTVKTARYDDIKNGTDIIVEYSQKGGGVSNLGLGVDITYRKTCRKWNGYPAKWNRAISPPSVISILPSGRFGANKRKCPRHRGREQRPCQGIGTPVA